MKSLSCVRLFVTPWTVAYQAPLSMRFSRQEDWRGVPFPSPEDLPDPGIEPGSPALQADALLSEPPGKSQSLYKQKNKKQHLKRGMAFPVPLWEKIINSCLGNCLGGSLRCSFLNFLPVRLRLSFAGHTHQHSAGTEWKHSLTVYRMNEWIEGSLAEQCPCPLFAATVLF